LVDSSPGGWCRSPIAVIAGRLIDLEPDQVAVLGNGTPTVDERVDQPQPRT